MGYHKRESVRVEFEEETMIPQLDMYAQKCVRCGVKTFLEISPFVSRTQVISDETYQEYITIYNAHRWMSTWDKENHCWKK